MTIHLPKDLTQAEKAQPQQVKVTRDIMPQEAMHMIATQQGKIVRLLMALSEVENRMHSAQERSRKAVSIAAQKSAQAKLLTEDVTALLQQHADDVQYMNKQAEQLTMCGRVIRQLAKLALFVAESRGNKVFLPKGWNDQDGDVVFNHEPDGSIWIELLNLSKETDGPIDFEPVGSPDGSTAGVLETEHGIRLLGGCAAKGACQQVRSNETANTEL